MFFPFCCVSKSTLPEVESEVELDGLANCRIPRLSFLYNDKDICITVSPGNSSPSNSEIFLQSLRSINHNLSTRDHIKSTRISDPQHLTTLWSPPVSTYNANMYTPSGFMSTANTLWISTPSYSSYVPTPMTKVLPHLYLGSYDNATNELELFRKNITHILSLIGSRNTVEIEHYKQVPMNDYGRTDLKEVLEKVTKFVKEGQQDGHNLLIHCQSGQNRSASVVIALQIINQKKTLYEAHKELKRIRPIVQINVEYAKQLIALEKEILGKSSLPPDWMEREKFDTKTGVVTYKYENLNTIEHRSLKYF